MTTTARIKVPAELFALAESSRFQGSLELDSLEAGPDRYEFADPVEWWADVTNTGSALLVSGSVTGTGVCPCSRCLDDVAFDFAGEIQGFFLIEGQDGRDAFDDEDEELGDDEFDVLPADHIIDLVPLIEAALMVDAPVMPLCREDCAGLCPTCGSNLNEGDCGCGEDEALGEFERAANPFSVLADLTFE